MKYLLFAAPAFLFLSCINGHSAPSPGELPGIPLDCPEETFVLITPETCPTEGFSEFPYGGPNSGNIPSNVMLGEIKTLTACVPEYDGENPQFPAIVKIEMLSRVSDSTFVRKFVWFRLLDEASEDCACLAAAELAKEQGYISIWSNDYWNSIHGPFVHTKEGTFVDHNTKPSETYLKSIMQCYSGRKTPDLR